MKILFEDGLEKALQGITTLDEVTRVCEEIAEPRARPAEIMAVEPYFPPEEEKGVKVAVEHVPQPEEINKYTKKIMDWISRRK
ncbi:MAG TPA: hypothetical protein ENF97_01330 [Candidatus Omnitrophica bacterium]|nr:hypothetical protein [Candidatus Omnitrophota bacterium]